ncbi:MAG: AAA family ATPase [Candidatus ainarchaeum sp.]|nr:AAA family ATPase [Candidatus ainarchaeum sp.]MDD3975984.1 AAA family ATPase [Candidatus ainarchaeum sp.]
MFLLITGVPGCGKTTISSEIKRRYNKQKFIIINDLDFSKSNNLGVFDKDTNEYVVDLKKLNLEVKKYILKNSRKNLIFEGHLWAELSKQSLLIFDYIFIINISETKLRERLFERKYNVLKIEDNIFCQHTNYFSEIFKNKNVPHILINSTDDLKLNIKKLEKYIKF